MQTETGATRPPAVGQRFEHDGPTLVYDDSGPREALPVMLLHGLSMSRLTWGEFGDRLADRLRVLRLDLRGHGDADRAPDDYTIPAYASDIATFCERVVGRPVALVGHSLGGMVAACLAATRPDLVTRAVLLDPPLFIFEPETWPRTIGAQLIPTVHQVILAARSTPDPEEAARQALHELPSLSGQGTMADARGPLASEQQAQAWAQADPEAFEPLLALEPWGDHDVDSPIEPAVMVIRADPELGPAFAAEHEARFRHLAPAAHFVVAEGCSHVVHEEEPAWLAQLVCDFLAEA